jgi:hypothetical protein
MRRASLYQAADQRGQIKLQRLLAIIASDQAGSGWRISSATLPNG